MKKDIKKLWVKALRSGKYKKTTGMLHREGGGYCCLGVLTELYMKSDANTTGQKRWKYDYGKSMAFQYQTGGLDATVMKWAGLKSDIPTIGMMNAAELNDGDYGKEIKRHSFKQIADLIDKHL